MTSPTRVGLPEIAIPLLLMRSPIFLAAACLCAATATAQSVTAVQLDSLIRKTVADKHVVGLSVGVMQNGRVLLVKGYGVRDLATRDSVTTRTMFGIGSVTKQFTC